MFQLIGNTELRTLGPIDRESLESDVINLLAVSESGSQAPIEIMVKIDDVNDNDPVFPADDQVVIDLPESTEIGTQVNADASLFTKAFTKNFVINVSGLG